MTKFDSLYSKVVVEEAADEQTSEVGGHYKKVIEILKDKGLMSHDMIPVLDVVKQAYMSGYQEGRKATEQNPFK